MTNSLHLLHYESLTEFKKQFYKGLLTLEHIQGGECKINKLSYPDGSIDDEANFWGFILKKDNVKYLLPNKTKTGQRLQAKDMLPILVQDPEKVAYKSDVYWLINKPVIAKFRPEKRMTFKELIDLLADIEHSNPAHRKLLIFIAMTSMIDRANFRISSPPASGKDSVVDTLGALFGNATTAENPTLAKLEYLTSYKWLVVNEVVDIALPEWRKIEQFLLAVGAHKPSVAKHSRAFEGVGETLDISQLSVSLMYNDVDCYPDVKDYVDFVAKDAVLDRFPAFRLHGVFKANFNEIRKVDVPLFVEKNFEVYKSLVHTFVYYKENVNSCLHHYNISKLKNTPQRWNFNLGKLLKIVDMYCDTQEEFDEWIKVINDSLNDYQNMLDYGKTYQAVIAKIMKDSLKNEKLVSEKMSELKSKLKDKILFADKLVVLKEEIKGKKKDDKMENKSFWDA